MTASRSVGTKEKSPGDCAPEALDADQFPQRIDRYGKAKRSAIGVAILAAPEDSAIAQKIHACGDFLLFRNFYTIGKIRLHAANFCKKHLLCQLCALRRGAKALAAYLPRYEAISAARPDLRPFLVTLTVKGGPDLAERWNHLHKAQRELWKRKGRAGEVGRTRLPSSFGGIEAAVWSYEVKRGSGSGEWHPHLHMVALAATKPDAFKLSAEWHDITGDSKIVDVRPIDTADPVAGFCEVFKYAVKFSDQPPADTWTAFHALKGRRLVASAGLFRGVVVDETDADPGPDFNTLPFVEILARFCGKSYVIEHRHGVAA